MTNELRALIKEQMGSSVAELLATMSEVARELRDEQPDLHEFFNDAGNDLETMVADTEVWGCN